MRILNTVLGDASGGRWQVVCQYSQLLLAAGHRVGMLVDSRHRGDPAQIPDQVELLLLRNRGHYDYLAAWRARARVREFGPDIAIAHCSRSVALLSRALVAHVPLVAVSHSNKVKRLLPADAWIALTDSIARKITASPKAAGKRCYVIPNMIAVDPARPLPPRPANRVPRVGALGRFDRVKGFDIYIAALDELKSQGIPFTALLGGAGSEEKMLVSLLRRAGLTDRVELPGWVNEVAPFLAGLDVLVVPARSDAFGLTPLQAAVAGIPLVLSRASGHRQMFAEETEALFCDIDDSHATARQIARIVQQPALAEQLRQAALRRVIAQYSEPAVSVKLLQAIESIAKNKYSNQSTNIR